MIDEKYIKRFWEKVVVRGDDDCWPWTASTDGRGYGQMKSPFIIDGNKSRRNLKAPRISLMIKDGILDRPVPRDMYACHVCDNPICVNPKHLFWGTNKENQADSVKKGRRMPVDQKGENNHNSKLSAKDKTDILAMLTIGRGDKEIANQYSVSRQSIGDLRRNHFRNEKHNGRYGPMVDNQS